MLIITMAANGEPLEQVFGCVGCEQVAPINEFPRRLFEQHRRGCTVPMPGPYYAGDWWQFIGGRP